MKPRFTPGQEIWMPYNDRALCVIVEKISWIIDEVIYRIQTVSELGRQSFEEDTKHVTAPLFSTKKQCEKFIKVRDKFSTEKIKWKLWVIDYDDNWKLKKHTEDYITYHNIEGFKSKKKALKFVLKEANKRFKGVDSVMVELYGLAEINNYEIKIDYKWDTHYAKVAISVKDMYTGKINYLLWSDKHGWGSEPLVD